MGLHFLEGEWFWLSFVERVVCMQACHESVYCVNIPGESQRRRQVTEKNREVRHTGQ